MDFIIIFVIIGAIIIGLNQLESQNRAKVLESSDNPPEDRDRTTANNPPIKISKRSKRMEQWLKDRHETQRLASLLEKREREKNPKYISHIGRVYGFPPAEPRFALVEEVVTDQKTGQPYIEEYCVDCLLIENLVTEGTLVLFHYAGQTANKFGNDVQYGIAVSAFDNTQDEQMQRLWSDLYQKAKLSQHYVHLKTMSESL